MPREEFPAKVKDQAAIRAAGKCEKCKLSFAGKKPEFHHILECAFGGKPTLANCMCICEPCHKEFSAKGIARIRKADRQRRAGNGAKSEPRVKIQSPPKRGKPEPKRSLKPLMLYK